MSLADYTGLKASVSDWLHRADISSQADDFIDLFETKFNSEMRVRQMEQRTQITSTSGYLVHPSNWLSWKYIKCTSGGETYTLEPASDEVLMNLTGDEASSSTPKYFKVEGTRTYTYPPASGVVFTTCYHEGVSLSSGTNWLLTSYPGAYLYGSLLQANAWSMDDAQVQKWMAAYDIAMEAIRKDSRRSEWQGGPLQMKISGTVV